MFENVTVWLLKNLLKGDVTEKTKSKLSTLLLEKFHALPFRDIITVNDKGSLLINGRPLDVEQAVKIRESASSALQSIALNLISDQVLFNAVSIGVHKVERPEQMMFSRAAIWWGQQQHELLKLLAGEIGTSPNLED